jgi:hypothetical protein
VAGADADSARAVELARAADAQPQSRAVTTRARVALELGRLDEARALASELLAMGHVVLPAMGSAAPTLTDAAWVFGDLGLEASFEAGILGVTPITGGWMDAARAITAGEPLRAAEIIDGMGHAASAAYTRVRAADALEAEGRTAEAAVQRGAAEGFVTAARATAWQAGARSRVA